VVWYKSFLYQAASWNTARRVVAKVELHFGELFPRVGFIATNLETDSRAVVRFYNQRGTAEQWIKERKQAVRMTRLSCHRFRSNEVRLWLSVPAYNLGNLWRGVPSGPGPAEADRELVVDEPAATVGEGRRQARQACAVLLAAAGREPSHTAPVRGHGAPNRSAAGAHRIGCGREANRAKEGSGRAGV
jgi:Transposase DDE domain group 1